MALSDFDYDDHGPLDSPDGDSESDHVWADLARSESEFDEPETTCENSPDGHCEFATATSEECRWCGE